MTIKTELKAKLDNYDADQMNELQKKSHIEFRQYCERTFGEKHFFVTDDGEYESQEISDSYYAWNSCFSWLTRELKNVSN